MRSVTVRAQHGLAGAAGEPHPVAVADAALSASCGWISSTVLVVPDDVGRAPRLRADVVLR
jgi:hypothetical protein